MCTMKTQISLHILQTDHSFHFCPPRVQRMYMQKGKPLIRLHICRLILVFHVYTCFKVAFHMIRVIRRNWKLCLKISVKLPSLYGALVAWVLSEFYWHWLQILNKYEQANHCHVYVKNYKYIYCCFCKFYDSMAGNVFVTVS